MNSRSDILSALVLAALAWLVVGCGSSETVDAPKIDPDGPFDALAVGTDSTLEVVTWNVRTFPYPTRREDGHDPQTTIDLVIQAIRGLDADIYALQEIRWRSHFDEVVAGLDGWAGLTGSDDDYNLAYIYRNDGRFEDLSFTEILGGYSYPDPLPRDPFVMMFTFGGTPVAVINNHLKCCGDGFIEGGDPTDEETRRRDANLLLEEYINANLADRAVILVGDLNDELDDPEAHNVFANFLAAPARWRFLDLEIALDGGALWSYPSWPSHIDHVLVTDQLFGASEKQNALIEVLPMHSVMDGGMYVYNRDLSDHLPVAVRLDLD